MATQEQIQKVAAKIQDEFAQQRITKLSSAIFPKEEYHPLFMETLHKLLKFNSFKQMGISQHTWKNMCTFEREFFMPEIDVCLEILLRCTPREIIDFNAQLTPEEQQNTMILGKLKTDKEILDEFNNVAFPKILEIVKPMRKVFNKIDDSISTPIANKLESNAKISLQLPIGTQVKFIQRPTYN